MIDYRRAGRLPDKPHTVFRNDDGGLFYEQCFTRDGFDGPFSILYHQHPPQLHGQGERVEAPWPERKEAIPLEHVPLRRRHLDSVAWPRGGTPMTGRVPVAFNSDITVGFVRPTEEDAVYLANGDGDDLFYVHEGGGQLKSPFGTLEFGQGDYVLVPRAVPHRFSLTPVDQHWVWFELRTGIETPARYRNPIGQLRMDAPYTHRDFRAPVLTGGPIDDPIHTVISHRAGRFTRHQYANPVLDTVGWDGTVYPFAFSIRSFSPKIGQVHLPPTVHGTFASRGSLVCSFVPRVVDFHENAIPCPYPHSNPNMDELIFYCDGDFTSRRGVHAGSISLHPAGVPHGPHPGAYERSIGATRTSELAVMLDTFEPLRLTAAALGIEIAGYDETWTTP